MVEKHPNVPYPSEDGHRVCAGYLDLTTDELSLQGTLTCSGNGQGLEPDSNTPCIAMGRAFPSR